MEVVVWGGRGLMVVPYLVGKFSQPVRLQQQRGAEEEEEEEESKGGGRGGRKEGGDKTK